MSARKNLANAYDSWEQMTLCEGQAIHESNWPRVNECQKTKRELQEQIVRLTEAANAECTGAGLKLEDFERDQRQIINSLIMLETRNAELLGGRRHEAESHKAEMDHACRNLRRVKKSYVQPSAAAWNSYS